MFRRTMRVPNSPVCMLYIICWAAEVSLQHASGHLEKCPRPRCPGQRTCAVQASTTRRPVYASIYVKGLLLLVPPPRSCVYVAYAHAFYVVMCYMSITCICQLYVLKCYMSLKCYVSVMCLVLAASCICICLLYVVICYMSLKCYMSVICLV